MNGSRSHHVLAGAAACLLVTLIAALVAGVVALALSFPPLTGRIVDQANIIPLDTRSAIEPMQFGPEIRSPCLSDKAVNACARFWPAASPPSPNCAA